MSRRIVKRPAYPLYRSPRPRWQYVSRTYSANLANLDVFATYDRVGVFQLVTASTEQGFRTVKNFSGSIALSLLSSAQSTVQGGGNAADYLSGTIVVWNIQYVPHGNNAAAFSVQAVPGNTDTLLPNQNIIAQGIGNILSPIRFYSPLARKLNEGDRIDMAFRVLGGANVSQRLLDVGMNATVYAQISYVLKYN